MLWRIAILDPVSVKVENKMVPLRDLAQVSIKDAKTLMVNVNDVEVRQLCGSFCGHLACLFFEGGLHVFLPLPSYFP